MAKLGAIVAVVVAVCWGCGGGGTVPPSPPRTSAERAVSVAREPVAKASAPPARAHRPSCDDGSCFACGEATCMAGFYCAASQSGHGCAWVPSCAVKPTCACVMASLRADAACGCIEKGGGVYLSCDGAKL
jgi:hypothetical protein